jgi:predicted nucleotide-binding protein
MPYYHVAIANKRSKIRWAFAFDMSRDQVHQQIVVPFEQQQPFMCGRRVIHPSEIEIIKISETDEKCSEILARGQKKRNFRKVMSRLASQVGDESEHIDEWCVIDSGKDVTSELIVGVSLPKEPSKEKRQLSKPDKDTIFIVHGREIEQALLLQKYLREKSNVKAVLFDDLSEKSRTVIEQLEYIRDHVCYAFVIVTPDDVGCLSEEIDIIEKSIGGHKTVNNETLSKIFEMLKKRARQNVVFELGLFIGALGRENVCCLLRKGVEEKPSDIDGILYKPFEKSVTEIFHEINEEIKR